MHDDLDPSIIGRRSSDGDLISFREAVKMFATKDELLAMGVGIKAIAAQVQGFVTREEHVVRWQRDDEFRLETKATLEELKSQRLPQWVATAGGIIVAIGIAWYGAHH